MDDSRFDENDLEDVDDIMDYYRLDTKDLIGLGESEVPVEKPEIYDESYYLDNL
jgi:hypothetical protein